ncbi:MAG TPA: NAD-dependent epimerase/dehydratase family protein [Thermoflexia bacterium]|nr:NAD-dependent epimerase/dehydratase family protein [Thermoflexia bacterium]
MRVLITGATGFIGWHLARYLMMQGHRVRALVRRESPALTEAGVELARGDITDFEAVRATVDGVEAIFHLAAARDVWGTPEPVYQRVNVEGTQHLLDAAAEAGARRFVYCSSVGVARYAGNLQADETMPFSEPTSQIFYHRTKAQAERMALDARAVVVRPVITYGPRDGEGFVTRLITLLAQGQLVWVGNGRNHVDLVYIDDLVLGMYTALVQGTAGRVYILSGTAPIQVRALVDKICKLVEARPPRIRIPASCARLAGWGMEMLYRIAHWEQTPFITRDKVATLTVDRGFSHARASRELGYQPQVSYDEGLRRTLDWLQERKI